MSSSFPSILLHVSYLLTSSHDICSIIILMDISCQVNHYCNLKVHRVGNAVGSCSLLVACLAKRRRFQFTINLISLSPVTKVYIVFSTRVLLSTSVVQWSTMARSCVVYELPRLPCLEGQYPILQSIYLIDFCFWGKNYLLCRIIPIKLLL